MPDFTNDIFIATGSYTFCGDLNIYVEYVEESGMVSDWLTIDEVSRTMQMSYTSHKTLGVN